MFLFCVSRFSSAKFLKDPLEQIIGAFGRGNDVERGRDGAALLEVRDPQFGPRELPLDVGLLRAD